MVIAHVLSSFRVGGQERVAFDLGVGQRARGHRVLAISLAPPPDGPLAAELRRAGIDPHTVPKRGPTVDPTLPLRLAALLRREGVTVVHTHNPQPLVYAALAARLAGAALVQTRHGVAYRSDRQVWLVRQAGRLADAHVAVSRELAAAIADQRPCPPERLEVVENGVDLVRFRPDERDRREIRRTLGLPAEALVIGTVSRLVALKNVEGLARACAPLLGQGVRLVVVGDGPERPRIEALAAQAGCERAVHLLGARPDVSRLLRALDLFVLFSRSEGHPLCVLEAMATGLPVVATRVGGIPSIVQDGVSGILIPVDDEPALRAAIERLAADPGARAQMGRRARETALARYSVDRMVDDYLVLYARCRGKEEIACSPSLSSASASWSTPTSATRP